MVFVAQNLFAQLTHNLLLAVVLRLSILPAYSVKFLSYIFTRKADQMEADRIEFFVEKALGKVK